MAENPQNKLRVMVDANILVAGIGWPRFPYEVLQHAFLGDYQLVLTAQIINEARYSAQQVIPDRSHVLDAFLEEVEYELIPVPTEEEIQAHPDLVRDPKDIHVALAAINAQVNFLVSQDKDFTSHDQTTRVLHERLNILLPAVFLRQHMSWTSEALESIRKRTWKDMASR
jgi:predicted nucleic acid-binding protein